MKYASTSDKIAVSCIMLAFITADIAVAQDFGPPESEDAETLALVSSDDLPESDGEDYLEDYQLRADEPTRHESDQDDQLQAGEPTRQESDQDDQLRAGEPTRQESDQEELRRSFESYKAAIEMGSYDEADSLAKRIVELSIQLHGLDSHESAKALSNLGLAQQKNKDYKSAVLNFTAAIDIVEQIEDRLHRELIRPLRGLGAAQLGSGRADLARDAFDRAAHISHVNDGPNNLMQIGILEDLAEIHLTLGNIERANDLHEYIYNLEARNTDLNSESIIPALERLAKWLHRMNSLEKERLTWRRIIHVLEKNRGKKDLSLIDPLTGLGTSYLYQPAFQETNYVNDGTMTSGDTYLKRAVRIADQNTDAPWATKLQTKLALADFYTLSLRPNRASRIYKEAWDFLSNDDARLATRGALFDQPRLLHSIHPPKYFNSQRTEDDQDPPDIFELGTVVVSYNISDRGFARDIKIVEADPPGLKQMEFSVAREARRLIHRPRLQDGKPIATLNQSYVHEFYYRPSDLPQPEDEHSDIDQSADMPQPGNGEVDIEHPPDMPQPGNGEVDIEHPPDMPQPGNDEADVDQASKLPQALDDTDNTARD